MSNIETIESILVEIKVLDEKLENKEISIKDYLFWKKLYQTNLVHCYSNMLEDTEKD